MAQHFVQDQFGGWSRRDLTFHFPDEPLMTTVVSSDAVNRASNRLMDVQLRYNQNAATWEDVLTARKQLFITLVQETNGPL